MKHCDACTVDFTGDMARCKRIKIEIYRTEIMIKI